MCMHMYDPLMHGFICYLELCVLCWVNMIGFGTTRRFGVLAKLINAVYAHFMRKTTATTVCIPLTCILNNATLC